MKTIILQNDLVLLRPIELTDAQEIFEAGADERIWTHISFTIETKSDAESFVNSAITSMGKGEKVVFAILDKLTNAVIGSTSYMDINHTHKHLEIGSTWLTPNYWRTSINTNCKFLLLEYAFETLEFERVQIKTDNLNVRSQDAIERIGATFEGQLRSHMKRKDGSMRDTMMYSFIRSEWPEKKLALLELLAQEEDR